MGVRARSFDFSIFFLFFMLYVIPIPSRKKARLLAPAPVGLWRVGNWGLGLAGAGAESEISLRHIHHPSAISHQQYWQGAGPARAPGA